MLGVNVTYVLKAGMRDSFLAEIAACGVQEAIRKENGCLQYDYFLPLGDPDRLLLMEKWTSPESQKLHTTQPHMALVAAAKARYVQQTQLEFYTLEG